MLVLSPIELGAYCRDQRKLQQLSQADVGSSVGLKQATVSAFETDPSRSQIETMFRILAANNLELHIIAKGENNIQENKEWGEQW